MSTTKTETVSKDSIEFYTTHGTNRNKPRSMYYADELETEMDRVRAEANPGFPISKKQWIEQALIEKTISERKRLGIKD